MHVRSGDPATGELELTTFCRTVFVVLDEQRRAAPVPRWEPASEEDEALDAHAVELMAIRERFGD